MNLAHRSVAAFLTLAACSAAAFADAHVDSRRLRVRLDPASGTVEGVAELTVAVDAPSVLTLELAAGLQVTSVLRDGAAVEPVIDSPLGNGATAWRFPLDATADAKARALVSVTWSGMYEAPPGASFTSGRIDLPLSARWSPTPDHATPWEARLDVPTDLRCVLRGVPKERVESGDRAVETWSSDLPSQGLALAAGPWASVEQVVDRTTIAVWGAEPDPELLSEMATAFEAVSVVLGPCPAARFDVLPDDVLMAAAAPGLGSRVWGDPATQAARAWWGHAVSEDRAGGAWADALALYVARQLVVEDTDPEAALRFRKETMAHLTPDAAADDPHRRLLAFHALREEIGSAAFSDALRAVLRDRTGDAIGWDEWSRAFSNSAGRDVSSRVEQWTTRQGAPLLELSRAKLTTAGGRIRISGTIRQAVRAGEDPWRLTVPVVVELVSGTQTVLVEVGGDETGFSEILDGLPVSVAVDPQFRVPRRLVPGPGKKRLVTERSLLPDVDRAANSRRVGAVLKSLAAAADDKTARRIVLDEFRIAGLDAKQRTLDVTVRARATNDVLVVGGTPVQDCYPLTCSPETTAGGVTVVGIALDPGDEMAGRALLIDVPRTTTDLVAFARGLSGLARSSGAVALVLRLPEDGDASIASAWRTPADATSAHGSNVLLAHRAQATRGVDLALPTVVAPATFQPEGAFAIHVRWREESASVSSIRASVKAPHGRAGAVVIAAHVGRGVDPSGAAAAVEAAQLVGPIAALLGRDVEILLLPSGDDHVSAVLDMLDQLGVRPAAVLHLRTGGPVQGESLRVLATTAAANAALTVAACAERVEMQVDATGATSATSAFGSAGYLAIDAPPGAGVSDAIDAGCVTRVARAIALASLAISVAP